MFCWVAVRRCVQGFRTIPISGCAHVSVKGEFLTSRCHLLASRASKCVRLQGQQQAGHVERNVHFNCRVFEQPVRRRPRGCSNPVSRSTTYCRGPRRHQSCARPSEAESPLRPYQTQKKCLVPPGYNKPHRVKSPYMHHQPLL